MFHRICDCFCGPCFRTRTEDRRDGDVSFVNQGFQLELQSQRSGSTKGGRTHPLDTPWLLGRILSHLEISDLLSCRLVCHAWLAQASKATRLSSPLVWINPLEMSGFVKLMTKTRDLPFTRFGLNLTSPLRPSQLLRPDLRRLMSTIGPRLTYLLIHIFPHDLPILSLTCSDLEKLLVVVEPPPAENGGSSSKISRSYKVTEYGQANNKGLTVGRSRSSDLPRLEHLQEMSLETRIPDLEATSEMTFAMGRILESAFQLSSLDLKKWSSPLASVFSQEKSWDVLASVTRLSLSVVSPEELTSIARRTRRLVSLDLTLASDVNDETFFQALVGRNAETLRRLEVGHEGAEAVFYIPEALTALQILVIKRWLGPMLLDSVTLRCPNLVELGLRRINPDSVVCHGNVTQETVQSLALGYDRDFAKRKIKGVIKKLLPRFPKLNRFEGTSCVEADDVFQLILSNLGTGMRDFSAQLLVEVSDAALTGIPLDSLESASRDEIEMLPCGCWVFLSVETKRKNVYIGQLLDLTNLVLSIEPASPITNVSLHHGIFDLKKLKSLRLYSPGMRWCLLGVADNLPDLEKLQLSKAKYHHDDLAYLQYKLPDLSIELEE